eukprot:g2137.t1
MLNMIQIDQLPPDSKEKRAKRTHWDEKKPQIGRIAPLGGPVQGGTQVRVWGTNIPEDGELYKCKFGRISVDATYNATSGEVVCVSPPYPGDDDDDDGEEKIQHHGVEDGAPLREGGIVPFHVVIFAARGRDDRVHHYATKERGWRYYRPATVRPQLFRIDPSSGSRTGGTQVTVYGEHLSGKRGYFCTFGSERVPGRHEHASADDPSPSVADPSAVLTEKIICEVPKYARTGVVPFRVVTDEHGESEERLDFVYVEPLELSTCTIDPPVVQLTGGDLVRVTCGNGGTDKNSKKKTVPPPPEGEEYRCRFGGRVVVRGFYDRSDGSVACVVPSEGVLPASKRNPGTPWRLASGGDLYAGADWRRRNGRAELGVWARQPLAAFLEIKERLREKIAAEASSPPCPEGTLCETIPEPLPLRSSNVPMGTATGTNRVLTTVLGDVELVLGNAFQRIASTPLLDTRESRWIVGIEEDLRTVLHNVTRWRLGHAAVSPFGPRVVVMEDEEKGENVNPVLSPRGVLWLEQRTRPLCEAVAYVERASCEHPRLREASESKRASAVEETSPPEIVANDRVVENLSRYLCRTFGVLLERLPCKTPSPDKTPGVLPSVGAGVQELRQPHGVALSIFPVLDGFGTAVFEWDGLGTRSPCTDVVCVVDVSDGEANAKAVGSFRACEYPVEGHVLVPCRGSRHEKKSSSSSSSNSSDVLLVHMTPTAYAGGGTRALRSVDPTDREARDAARAIASSQGGTFRLLYVRSNAYVPKASVRDDNEWSRTKSMCDLGRIRSQDAVLASEVVSAPTESGLCRKERVPIDVLDDGTGGSFCKRRRQLRLRWLPPKEHDVLEGDRLCVYEMIGGNASNTTRHIAEFENDKESATTATTRWKKIVIRSLSSADALDSRMIPSDRTLIARYERGERSAESQKRDRDATKSARLCRWSRPSSSVWGVRTFVVCKDQPVDVQLRCASGGGESAPAVLKWRTVAPTLDEEEKQFSDAERQVGVVSRTFGASAHAKDRACLWRCDESTGSCTEIRSFEASIFTTRSSTSSSSSSSSSSITNSSSHRDRATTVNGRVAIPLSLVLTRSSSTVLVASYEHRVLRGTKCEIPPSPAFVRQSTSSFRTTTASLSLWSALASQTRETPHAILRGMRASAPCAPSPLVRFVFHRGTTQETLDRGTYFDDNRPRPLAWRLDNKIARERATKWDLVCLWAHPPSSLSYEKGEDSRPLFLESYIAGETGHAQIGSLSRRFRPGTQYEATYVSRTGPTHGCKYDDDFDVEDVAGAWGSGRFTVIPPPAPGLFTGVAPLDVVVDLSSNGQQWDRLPMKLRYVDPWWRNLNWDGDMRNNVFSFHPNRGPATGGTLVTVIGLPARLAFEPSGGYACKFGDAIVPAWFDAGDEGKARDRVTFAGACDRLIARACEKASDGNGPIRGDRCVRCLRGGGDLVYRFENSVEENVDVSDCLAACYAGDPTKRLLMRSRVRPKSLRCFAPEHSATATTVVDFAVLIGDDYVFDEFTTPAGPATFTYYPSLRIKSVRPPVGACGTDLRVELEGVGKKPLDAMRRVVASADEVARAIRNVTLVLKFGAGGSVGVASSGGGGSALCVLDSDASTKESNGGGEQDDPKKKERERTVVVRCTVPPGLRSGRHHLTLSANGQQFSPTGSAAFVSHHTPHAYNVVPNRGPSVGGRDVAVSLFFFSFYPRIGPSKGGTTVRVQGHGMAGGHAFECRFGGRVVKATRVYAKQRTPEDIAKGFSEGEDLASSKRRKKGSASSTASSDNPQQRQIVTRDTAGVVELLCVVPPAASPFTRNVEFSVSVDGRHFTVGGGCDSTFTYYVERVADAATRGKGGSGGDGEISTPPRLARLLPSQGPTTGGELVRIAHVGHVLEARRGADANLRCRFGETQMRALFDVSDGMLKCLAPPHAPGVVSVGISVNGGEDFLDVFGPSKLELRYHYWNDPARAAKAGRFALWPFGGSERGGTKVTVLGHLAAMPPVAVANDRRGRRRVASYTCHFGDGTRAVPARLISESAGGVLSCVSPPLAPYVSGGAVRFGVKSSDHDEIVWDIDETRWTWLPNPSPLALSPSVGDARGNVEIHIRGANLTRTRAWHVRVGSRQVRGIWDGGRGVVVALTPPLDPGVWPVSLSDDGGANWTPVPGRYLALETARLFVFASPGSVGAGSMIEIVYVPVSVHEFQEEGEDLVRSHDESAANGTNSSSTSGTDSGRLSNVVFDRIDVVVEGFPLVRLAKREDDSGEWFAILHVHEAVDVAVSTIRVRFADRRLPAPSSSLENAATTATHRDDTATAAAAVLNRTINASDAVLPTNASALPSMYAPLPSGGRTVRIVDSPAILYDDNAGRGWHWHRSSAQKSQWRLAPENALQGGKLWNDLGGVRVLFEGAAWQENAKGTVDVTDAGIRVKCKTPRAPKGYFDGVASVRVSLYDESGSKEGAGEGATPFEKKTKDDEKTKKRPSTATRHHQRRYTLEDTTPQHVFDTRYLTPSTGLNVSRFRISPATAALAGQIVPRSVLGRKLFDERVVYDVSESVGVSRDRVVVLGVDGESGVFAIECIKSRIPADPTCNDLFTELRRQASKPTSVVYDGIVTWALDPLFPNAEAMIDPETGLAYVKGVCSDPRFFSEATCLAAGRCQCNIGPDREGDNTRERCEASFFPSGQPCRFLPYNLWSDDGVMPVTFGKCSDPTKRTKEACLQNGKCSDPKWKTQDDCLRDGACGAPPTHADHDFSQYQTRKECEDPSARNGGDDEGTSGHCSAKATAKGLEVTYDYAQYANRAHCEEPKSRPKGKSGQSDKKKKKPASECGLCVEPSAPSTTVVFLNLGERLAAQAHLEPINAPSTMMTQYAGHIINAEADKDLGAGAKGKDERTLSDKINDIFRDARSVHPDQPTEPGVDSGTFTYSQFKTKEHCENPSSRPLPVVGTCSLPGASGFKGAVRDPKKETKETQADGSADPGLCLPIVGKSYPATFNCRHLTDQGKDPCEYPEKRKPVDCTTALFGATLAHCYNKKFNETKRWWASVNTDGTYPDLRIPHGHGEFSNRSDPEIILGPKCRWSPLGVIDPPVSAMQDGKEWMADCGPGPAGTWDPSKDPLGRDSDDPSCGKVDEIPPPGPPGKWHPGEVPPSDFAPGPPGMWFAVNQFNPDDDWTPGPEEQPTCPCNWQAKLYHLTKCNWKTCGPAKRGTPGGVVDFVRLKGPNEYVSDYQAYVMVGGGTMWMTLETGVATSWVMSMACFTQGCKKTKTYIGMFLPAMPPLFTPIDMFERGLLQLGAMFGMMGHTMMSVAGFFSFGTPFVMGLLDFGDIIGESSYNHTGAIGLAFWEDNMAHYLTVMDPMSDLITFMKTGNIFFPIPGTPALIMKPFQIWGIPWMFPTGLVMNFAFYFADAGGCFFMEASGGSGHLTLGGMSWIMVIPIALKLLVPSWLFVLSAIRIRGQSIAPCFFGACKATVHTGQFHISGPVTPVLMILEEIGAPKTCELIETLPDISFTLSGSTFTMNHNQYVIESEAYGEKECITAFTPVFQLIPGFGMWIFGDAWVHAFYTKFEVIPMKRVGFAISDGRYYEKNACKGGGIGPMGGTKSMKQEQKDRKKQQGKLSFEYGTNKAVESMGWKRYDNWMRDLDAMKTPNAADGVLRNPCPSSFRFREGACVPMRMKDQATAVGDYHDQRRDAVSIRSSTERDALTDSRKRKIESDVGLPRELSMEMWSEHYVSDGTSASERFFMNHGGDGFVPTHDDASPVFSFVEEEEEDGATAATRPTRSTTTKAEEAEEDALDEDEMLRREKEWERRAFHRTLPKDADLKRFHEKRRAKMSDAERRYEEARRDRVKNGVEPDFMRFKQMKGKIELPATEISGDEERKAMYRNMSAILRHMEPDLNVTRMQTRSWWRGESEEYIEKERLRMIAEWEEQLVTARRTAKSFKVKSMINKRVLRRVAEKMTRTDAELERALREEDERTRVGGDWNAWDKAPYHNASADLFLKAAKLYNVTKGDAREKEESKARVEAAMRKGANESSSSDDAASAGSSSNKTNATTTTPAASAASVIEQLKRQQTRATSSNARLRWHPPSKKEREFLSTAKGSKAPVLELIRDENTGEWREEVYVPPKKEEGASAKKEKKPSPPHDPKDVLSMYEVREKLWERHNAKIDKKHEEIEDRLRHVREETEASMRRRRRFRRMSSSTKDDGGQPLSP